MNGIYRKCVGIVVFNKQRKVLLCERRDLPKAWQFPQGGIEDGETLIEAAKRELREETSIVSAEPVDTISTPLRYTFPPEVKNTGKQKYDGQDMRWVLFRFNGMDSEINLATQEPEFSAYAWEDIDEAIKKIAAFKKNVYIKVVEKFKPIVEG